MYSFLRGRGRGMHAGWFLTRSRGGLRHQFFLWQNLWKFLHLQAMPIPPMQGFFRKLHPCRNFNLASYFSLNSLAFEIPFREDWKFQQGGEGTVWLYSVTTQWQWESGIQIKIIHMSPLPPQTYFAKILVESHLMLDFQYNHTTLSWPLIWRQACCSLQQSFSNVILMHTHTSSSPLVIKAAINIGNCSYSNRVLLKGVVVNPRTKPQPGGPETLFCLVSPLKAIQLGWIWLELVSSHWHSSWNQIDSQAPTPQQGNCPGRVESFCSFALPLANRGGEISHKTPLKSYLGSQLKWQKVPTHITAMIYF